MHARFFIIMIIITVIIIMMVIIIIIVIMTKITIMIMIIIKNNDNTKILKMIFCNGIFREDIAQSLKHKLAKYKYRMQRQKNR